MATESQFAMQGTWIVDRVRFSAVEVICFAFVDLDVIGVSSHYRQTLCFIPL